MGVVRVAAGASELEPTFAFPVEGDQLHRIMGKAREVLHAVSVDAGN